MTSVTPAPQQGSAQTSSLPVLTSLVLIGGFILVLVILLGGLNPSTTSVTTPHATSIAAIETSISATTAPTSIPTPTTAPTTVASLPENASNAGHGVTVVLPYPASQISQGQSLFQGTCFACHNMDARGIPGLGKDLVDSTFALGLTDADLRTFVSNGRQPWDPMNTTGVQMPPRGGNPLFTDSDLDSIISFLRSLQVSAGHIPAEFADAPRGDLASVDPNGVAAATTLEPGTTSASAASTAEATSAVSASSATEQPFVSVFDRLHPSTATPTESAAATAEATAESTSAASASSATDQPFVSVFDRLHPSTAAPTESAAATAEATAELTAEATAAATESTGAAVAPETIALFERDCASCHGSHGEGGQQPNGAAVAPLSASANLNDDAAMFTALNARPSFNASSTYVHTFRVIDRNMTDDQLRALIDYAQSLVGQ